MAGRRPAEWRFPNEKQQRKEEMERKLRRDPVAPAQSDEDAWWDAVLSVPRAVTSFKKYPYKSQCSDAHATDC